MSPNAKLIIGVAWAVGGISLAIYRVNNGYWPWDTAAKQRAQAAESAFWASQGRAAGTKWGFDPLLKDVMQKFKL